LGEGEFASNQISQSLLVYVSGFTAVVGGAVLHIFTNQVEVLPCNPDGTMIGDDDDPFVEDPSELVSSKWGYVLDHVICVYVG